MNRNLGNGGGLRVSRGLGAAPLCASLFLAVALFGCSGGSGRPGPEKAASPREPTSWRDEAKGVLAPRAGGAGAAAAPDEADRSGQWQIVLASFGGASAREEAQALAAQVQSLGLDGAYADQRGKGWVVAYGRYASLASPQAHEDLARIKQMTLEGDRPFAAAVLAPPEQRRIAGSIPEYDLATVRQRYGSSAAYTLQVAIYTRMDRREPSAADLAQFRKAAEEAANRLRREGQEAFYYHTARSSMVTVGVFTYKDCDATRRLPNGEITTGPAKESPAVAAAKERNPYNLVNGQAVKVRGELQASMLVQLP